MSLGWNSLAADTLYAYMGAGAPVEEIAFYERRIRENGGLALDQACGTGRHIFPLLERGLEVHGADVSADALRLARRAAEGAGVLATLFEQRMEDCDIPHRYGTIYVANGTFQVVSDRQDAQRTLARFWRHLSSGGQLLIELFVPDLTEVGNRVYWEPVPRRDAEGSIATTLWDEDVDAYEQVLLSRRRYDLLVDGNCVRSEDHAHLLRWYHKYEFFMMLERAGFEDLATFSDYTDEPATSESATVVYAGRRPT